MPLVQVVFIAHCSEQLWSLKHHNIQAFAGIFGETFLDSDMPTNKKKHSVIICSLITHATDNFTNMTPIILILWPSVKLAVAIHGSWNLFYALKTSSHWPKPSGSALLAIWSPRNFAQSAVRWYTSSYPGSPLYYRIMHAVTRANHILEVSAHSMKSRIMIVITVSR